MKLPFLFIVLLLYIHLHGQSYADMVKQFKQKEYTSVIETGKAFLKTDTTDARVYCLIGRCCNSQRAYEAAIPYFEKAIAIDHEATYVSGWAYACEGQALVRTGNTEDGVAELHKAIALDKTRNSVKFAENVLKNIDDGAGLTPATMPDWVVIDAVHIKYFFEDTAGISDSVKHFITRHESAYDTLNAIFQAQLPKKISFYVWLNPERARKVLHCPDLGFSDPEKCVINVRIGQTTGHEMTHVLSYWAWGKEQVNRTRFVSEGLGVAFDLTARNKIKMARKAIAGKKFKGIVDVWRHDDSLSEAVLYPIAGAFMQYLYLNSSSDNFKKFVKNQSIASAKNIYGKKNFGDLVHQFNTLIGF